MKIENYKTAMSEVRISEKKYSELCEMIADPDISDTVDIVIDNKSAKKKIRRIGTPAIIAAVVLLTVGGTVFAAELSGNSILNVYFYFSGVKEKNGISEVPIIDDVESVFTEVTASDYNGNESVRLVSAASDKYNIFVMLEYEADESVLTEDIPEDAVFGFEEHCSSFGISQQIECDPFSGNKFSLVYHLGGTPSLPEDDLVIDIKNFGFYSDDGFTVLSEGKLSVTVPMSEITVQQSIKANAPVQAEGITFEAELSPFGLLLYADHNALENWKTENNTNDKYLINLYNFRFYMRDGSDPGGGKSSDPVYGLIRAQTGWIDFEEGKEYISYSFSVPVDISEIDHISFHGEDFYFDVPQE